MCILKALTQDDGTSVFYEPYYKALDKDGSIDIRQYDRTDAIKGHLNLSKKRDGAGLSVSSKAERDWYLAQLTDGARRNTAEMYEEHVQEINEILSGEALPSEDAIYHRPETDPMRLHAEA